MHALCWGKSVDVHGRQRDTVHKREERQKTPASLSPENLLSALFSCWGSTLSSVLPRAFLPYSAISATCSFLESIFVCLGERKLNLVGGGDQDIYSVV